ncbi:Bug family tripartite tricarboxylate transporter substrate binding protein [Noviherbaspirillum sp.]|uniref:Bug family tripartite tricarboxylate transporter substrate binding protein n=1 Tax=Noviherbaspirillum sp. TaxID=1926288 RepID=UPI002FE3C1BF
MRMKFGTFARTGLMACAFMLSLGAAHAQDAKNYPDKMIKVVVPYPAGGATDTLGRMLANRLEGSWKQSAIVENKPGASGNIGSDQVAKSAPDGYTVLVGITAMIQAPFLYGKMPFDPFKAFQPVALLARSADLFVVPVATPANTLKDFVALVKANPGKYNYGSYGNATSSHIHGEMLKSQTGADLMHVPYKGAAPLVSDLLGGQITSAFVDVASIRSHLSSGKFKVLAVTGAQRFKILPDVPTMTELGYKAFEPYGWFGVFVPAGTPKEIVNKLSEEVAAMVRSPEGSAKIEGLGLQAGGEKADEFGRIMKTDSEIWGKVIKDSNIRIE